MPLRIAIVAALGILGWLFVVRPVTRHLALADLYNRINEDRCCTDGLRRSPVACARALDQLARSAPSDQLERCPALREQGSRDPARRLCGFLASSEDRDSAAAELFLANTLAGAVAQPACHRLGRIAAVREALAHGCDAAMPVADALPANDPQRAAILRRCGRPADAWPRPEPITVPPFTSAVQRTDAASALAACERRITECAYANVRSLDACAVSMPPCKTTQWWAEAEVCCPQACIDAYAAARSAGKNQISALMDAYGGSGACARAQ
jgi:hypothetical protein